LLLHEILVVSAAAADDNDDGVGDETPHNYVSDHLKAP